MHQINSQLSSPHPPFSCCAHTTTVLVARAFLTGRLAQHGMFLVSKVFEMIINLRGYQDTIQEAVRALTSKPAKRAVVNTVLLTAASFVLLFFAAIASALFFQSFVPDQVLSRPVYLQYG